MMLQQTCWGLAFLMIAVVAQEPVNKTCQYLGEEWSECQKGCALCSDILYPGRSICIESKTCTSGCQCEPGLLRQDGTGNCGTEEECFSTASAAYCWGGQIFSLCGSNDCTNTCEEPNKDATCQYPDGKVPCEPGCICPEGTLYVRQTGQCLPAAECEACQGQYEIFEEDYKRECFPAYPRERKRQCNCKRGFLYKSQTDRRCVLPEECAPRTCGTNEEWTFCGNTGCERSCTGNERYCYSDECIPGCVCSKGYYRNRQGQCVLPENCEKALCSDNEVFSKCPLDYCSSCNYANSTYSGTCTSYCNPGCDCAEGFYRDYYGNDTCVPLEQCSPIPIWRRGISIEASDARGASAKGASGPAVGGARGSQIKAPPSIPSVPSPPNPPSPPSPPGCGKNEEYTLKAPVCPETCSNGDDDRCCKTKPGCACVRGYVRESEGGRCIRREDCHSEEEHSCSHSGSSEEDW